MTGESHDAADKALSQKDQSWKTRMESVARQFKRLAERPVYDNATDQMVDVVGISCCYGVIKVQVKPTDQGEAYSTKLDNLSI